jgi:hypothetical protein
METILAHRNFSAVTVREWSRLLRHNDDVAIRITVEIPEPLHDRLSRIAARSGSSIRSLIVRALEQVYNEPKKGEYVTGPLVTGPGKLGPAFPGDENPHDLVFS